MHLLKDFKEQKHKIILFLTKLLVLLVLVFIIDRFLATFFKDGLSQYFGLNQSAEILSVGHSHSVLGIDKKSVENELGIIMAKYARSGANLRDRKAMIEQYFNLHPNSTKIVLYDVDAHLFTEGGLSRNSYQLFYPFLDNPVIKQHILKASPPWQELLLRKVFQTSRYNEMLVSQSMRGWLKKWTSFKHGQVNLDRLKKEIDSGLIRKIEFNDKSIALFNETLKIIKKENAIVVLVYIPTIDIMNEAEQEKFNQAISLFEKIADADRSIYFLNYNEPYSHQHDLFFDPVHLNAKGQKALTQELIKNLKAILEKRIQ